MIEGRKLSKLIGETVGENIIKKQRILQSIAALVAGDGFEPSTFGL